eukprot:jgi/Bigna1/88644/estExt_fgenesh1_pg.C_350117
MEIESVVTTPTITSYSGARTWSGHRVRLGSMSTKRRSSVLSDAQPKRTPWEGSLNSKRTRHNQAMSNSSDVKDSFKSLSRGGTQSSCPITNHSRSSTSVSDAMNCEPTEETNKDILKRMLMGFGGRGLL